MRLPSNRWEFWSFLIALAFLGSTSAFQTSHGRSLARSTFVVAEKGGEPLYASSTLEDKPISSFQRKLLERMRKTKNTRSSSTRQGVTTKGAIQEVNSLQEYKRVVVEEADGKLVVVWFYAKWCRACKAVSKGIHALSRQYPDVKFVQVPVTVDNTTLHKGLGVKSVPFVHLYHPEAGLAEESKLTRKYLPGFLKMLQDYRRMECSLEQGSDKEWSTSNPYAPEPNTKETDHEEGTVLRP